MSKVSKIAYRRTAGSAGVEKTNGFQVTLVVTPRQHTKLNALAKREKVSFSEAVRRTLDQAL